MQNGISIYGVIKTGGSLASREIDVGSTEAPAVFTIGFKDLAAVVSSNPLTSYDALSREKAIKDLAVHQLVLEKVMERFTVVPVKFGTMLESEDEVITFLEKAYTLLSDLLDKREGKIELDIAAWWELPEILPVIAQQNSRVREKQQEIAQKGDTVSLEDKMVLGQYIEQALNARKDSYQQVILQTLKQEAEDVCLHEPADDQMICNVAFLLEKKNEASFRHTIDALDQDLQSHVHFRVVGPLPTYSFSTIQIKRIDPDSVEAAKKTLGLPAEITAKAVHDAYHKLAKEFHPDRRGGEEDSEEFQRIHSAYITLRDFVDNGLIHPELYQYAQ